VEEKDFVKKETKFEHSPIQKPFKNHSFEPLYFSESIQTYKESIYMGFCLINKKPLSSK
jgi:hypothetical protein